MPDIAPKELDFDPDFDPHPEEDQARPAKKDDALIARKYPDIDSQERVECRPMELIRPLSRHWNADTAK